MKKILIILLAILLIAGGAYWYFSMRDTAGTDATTGTGSEQGGFSPFGRNPTGSTPSTGTDTTLDQISATSSPTAQIKMPVLRLLSSAPVGGYGASTTATTTVVRWVDRGRGNIYEAHGDSPDIITISNTVVPKLYESTWNKNANAFIASTLNDEETALSIVYADIKARILPRVSTSTSATSTPVAPPLAAAQTLTPYELKGKNLPENVIAYAASPKKDKLFMLVRENGSGIGYISTFDGKSVTPLFTTPLTQVNVEWPEDNTIAITTKGTSGEGGYLYFVDVKTGVWRKVIGPVVGISTKVSSDAKRVIVSTTGANKNVLTSIYTVAAKKGIDAIVQTLADKCVWGNFYKEMAYCAASSQLAGATYPDDWYKGTVSAADRIWQINGSTGEVKLISSVVDKSNPVIDAFNLGLDEKDDFLFFMNKNDLSLWSLDLVSSN